MNEVGKVYHGKKIVSQWDGDADLYKYECPCGDQYWSHIDIIKRIRHCPECYRKEPKRTKHD